jgi:hypothetical protein
MAVTLTVLSTSSVIATIRPCNEVTKHRGDTQFAFRTHLRKTQKYSTKLAVFRQMIELRIIII